MPHWAAAPSNAPRPTAPTPAAEDESPIPREARVEIDRVAQADASATHYDVLGVPRDAPSKAIKSAYYRLARDLHPDRYFRRDVGAYKERLERAFRRLTEAHDVLASRERRAEYDAYLAERDGADRLDDVVSTMPPPGEAPVEPIAIPRLQSGTRPVTRVGEDPHDVEPHLRAADLAIAQGDFDGAAHHYASARSVARTDEATVERLRVWVIRANEAIADALVRRAAYEAANERWDEALATYSRAMTRRPSDPSLLAAAATCILRSGQDAAEARELALQAIVLAPDEPAYRVVLAEIELLLGDGRAADAEIDQALALDPENPAAHAFRRRVRSG